ncbi:MAG TPA: hypothetical protein VIL49_17915 [Capillimicrobium sp.]
MQRYENKGTVRENPDMETENERGTSVSRSEVRFHTDRPVRAVLTRTGSYVTIDWPRSDDAPLPVTASFAHSGSIDKEIVSGLENGKPRWIPVPPPLERNCSATLRLGFDVSFDGSRVEAGGAGGLVVPVGDPFNGCPWGDVSGALYTAKGRTSIGALMRGRETELVLRGREGERDSTALYDTEWKKRTTVYVTFKRLG